MMFEVKLLLLISNKSTLPEITYKQRVTVNRFTFVDKVEPVHKYLSFYLV